VHGGAAQFRAGPGKDTGGAGRGETDGRGDQQENRPEWQDLWGAGAGGDGIKAPLKEGGRGTIGVVFEGVARRTKEGAAQRESAALLEGVGDFMGQERLAPEVPRLIETSGEEKVTPPAEGGDAQGGGELQCDAAVVDADGGEIGLKASREAGTEVVFERFSAVK
jgi:hypothetical protein